MRKATTYLLLLLLVTRVLRKMLLSEFVRQLLVGKDDDDYLDPIVTTKNEKKTLELTIPWDSDCSVCPLAKFSDLASFRSHYQSDWHVYNLKAKRVQGKSVPLEEYKSIKAENSSLFEDSSTEESSGELEEEEEEEEHQLTIGGSPFIPFIIRNNKGKTFQVYKSIIFTREELNQKVDRNVNTITDMKGRLIEQANALWIVFLIRSGRVAAVVYENANQRLLASKTFKRYTTRRSRGGSQLAKDSSKNGSIKSAGATIRRHNEYHLIADVQGLLLEWKNFLTRCTLIFWNPTASGRLCLFQNTNNMKSGSPLTPEDQRLRTIPFTSYKPTLEEAQRCYRQLSTVYNSIE